jgi:shikimate dehydrogenase
MPRFGLLRVEGPPSRSPELYRALWRGHSLEQELTYEVLEVAPRSDWGPWLEQAHGGGWSGFNATIPHKIDLWRCIPDRSPEAEAIGATNCIVRTSQGWVCHNTDSDGFWLSWEAEWRGYRPKNNCAWLLGNGGAARAIAHALRSRGFEVVVFARTPRTDFLGLEQHAFEASARAPKPDVVVNATSMGHGSQVALAPPIVWPAMQGAWAIDAVYGPDPTPFQIQAAQAGAAVLDGMPMLRMQAKKAWEYWARMLGITDF